ncbi:MAG: glycosyltransferase family 4 protein [Bryobacteraceae bacterium]|nr:glycosyltransferase family 4 protein [Bryobacteraceae bacterium]
MKLLILCNLQTHGGIETHIANLVPFLRDVFSQITLVTTSSAGSGTLAEAYHKQGIRYLCYNTSSTHKALQGKPKAAFQLCKYVLFNTYDVVYAVGSGGLFAFAKLLKPRCYFIANECGSAEDSVLAGWYALTLLSADRVVTLTSSIQRRMGRLVPLEDITCLPHLSRDMTRYPAIEHDRRDGRPPRLRIGYFGRLCAGKNLEWIVKAAQTMPDIVERVEFNGTGPLQDALVSQVSTSGLESKFAFNGGYDTTDELHARLKRVNVVALPSRGEGLPQSLIEAAMVGVPFVATKTGGIEQLSQTLPFCVACSLDYNSFCDALKASCDIVHSIAFEAQDLQRQTQLHYGPTMLANAWVRLLTAHN